MMMWYSSLMIVMFSEYPGNDYTTSITDGDDAMSWAPPPPSIYYGAFGAGKGIER